MVDLGTWRYNRPVWLKWPNGNRVGVLAKSRNRVDDLTSAATAITGDWPAILAIQYIRAALIADGLVDARGEALGLTGNDIMAALSGRQLAKIWLRWIEIQAASYPTNKQVDALSAEVELQLAESAATVSADAIAAHGSRNATDFFDSARGAISDRQLIYFLTLAHLYQRMFVQQGDGNTCINQNLLRRRAGRKRRTI